MPSIIRTNVLLPYSERKSFPRLFRMKSETGTLEHIRQLIRRCVKCGSCGAVCPTYRATRKESLSPRGRIALVDAVLRGELDATAAYRERLTTCSGCLACETVCPCKVPVTEIIQRAKEHAVEASGRGMLQGLLGPLIENQAVFGATAWLAPRALHFRHALRSEPAPGKRRPPESDGRNGTVIFYRGCAIRHLQPDVGTATVNVLTALGYRVLEPRGMECCGRPLLSLGDRAAAKRMALRNATVFARTRADAIVTACASCGLTFKKEYPTLLPPGTPIPAVLDIHEFLVRPFARCELSSVPMRITWHDPCHLGRGQGLARTARDLLARVPGIEFIEMRSPDSCCGFGGVMRVTHPELSNQIARDKVSAMIETGAETVVTGCPGCAMQLRDALLAAGSRIDVLLTAQLLERAVRAGDAIMMDNQRISL